MAAFHDVRLPAVIESGAEGGPQWSTSIATTLGGFEQRIGNWQMPRYKWQVSSGPRDGGAFGELLAFYNARAGRLFGFRFRDYADYEAPTGSPLWLDVTTGKYYLAKAYTSGPVTLLRKISRPVVGGVTLTAGSLNTATGEVTGSTTATWSGEFDVPVRFDSDELRITLDQVDIGTVRLDIMEIRE